MSGLLYPNGLRSRPTVTDVFGWRVHPIYGDLRLHGGTDSVGHPAGLNYAPEAGVITYAGYNGGAGNQITIQGNSGRVWRLKHNAHLNWVSVGQWVSLGQGLAPTGTTGDSTGIHCHTECEPPGQGLMDAFAVIAANLSNTAGGGTSPFDNNQGDDDMTIIYRAESASADKVIPKDFSYIQRPDGILRPLSGFEYDIYDWWNKNGIQFRYSPKSGDALREFSKIVGVMEHNGVKDGIPLLTGRIIYDDPAKADFPKVSAAGVAAPDLDYGKLAEALAGAIPLEAIGAEVIRQQKLPGN